MLFRSPARWLPCATALSGTDVLYALHRKSLWWQRISSSLYKYLLFSPLETPAPQHASHALPNEFQPNPPRLSAKLKATFSQTQGDFQPHLKMPSHRFSIQASSLPGMSFRPSPNEHARFTELFSSILKTTFIASQ